jgi:hypothetical protein
MTLPSSCSLTVSDAVVHAAYNSDEDARKIFDFLGSQPAALSTLAPSKVAGERTLDVWTDLQRQVEGHKQMENAYRERALKAEAALASSAEAAQPVAVTEQMVKQLLGDLALAFALNDVLVGYAECEKLARNMLANIVAVQNRALSTPAPSAALGEGEGDYFLTAYVSKDGRTVGIDHPTEADWNDVLTAHIGLRDRLNERIAEQEKCPFKPVTSPSAEAAQPVAWERHRSLLLQIIEGMQRIDKRGGLGFDVHEALETWIGGLETVASLPAEGELREGMVLVPREPTGAMEDAGYLQLENDFTDETAGRVYRAMIDAALAGRTAG